MPGSVNLKVKRKLTWS